MKLYYHKTSGGAEYLTDKYIVWHKDGHKGKEGIFKGANYVVRIDGDITKDAELEDVRENDRIWREKQKDKKKMKLWKRQLGIGIKVKK